MGERHLILYDGVCGLCNRLNQFLLPRDRKSLFRFAPLQSPRAIEILAKYGRDPSNLDTFYVVVDYESASPRLLSEARAALFVLGRLGNPWRWAGIVGILPDALLNAVYRLIARNRYRLFGRYETCLMPSPEFKNRFMD